MKVTCPNGIEFKSIRAMTKHYEVAYVTYNGRLRIGWSMAEALGIQERRRPGKYVVCPNGREFESQGKMAEYYGVRRSKYTERLRLGWTQSEALEIDPREQRKVVCPLGYRFKSVKRMAEYYGVGNSKYYERLRLGWTQSEALGIVKREKRTREDEAEELVMIEDKFIDKMKSLVKTAYTQGVTDYKEGNAAFEDGLDADVYGQIKEIFDEIIRPEMKACRGFISSQ